MTVNLTNVRAITMDPTHPHAGRITIDGGRIVAVDGPLTGGQLIDCAGGVLVPGFVDPHVHLLAAAAALCSVDCSPRAVRSIADIQTRLSEAGRDAADGWLRATGYDEFALAEGRHPTRWDLDAAVPARPVRLQHRSGHAVVLNSVAMAHAGISSSSEEPVGGVIERRLEDGEPTGLLIDMDAALERVMTPLPFDAMTGAMLRLGGAMLSNGVTAVQDLTHRNDARRLALIERLRHAAAFAPRLLPTATHPTVAGGGPVKLMLPEAAGVTAGERRRLLSAAEGAGRAGRQLAIHAVTEESVALALDLIERAVAAPPRTDHRHRIEHAALCPPHLMRRAASLGVVVVTNPAFLIEGGARYRATLPAADLPYLYAAGAMLRTGVTTAAASDAPVAPAAPLDAVRAAVERRDGDGRVIPGVRATVNNALMMVTRNAAFAAFADDTLGTLRPGMVADLVLLNDMPGAAPPPRVWWTLLNGALAYAGEDAPPFAA